MKQNFYYSKNKIIYALARASLGLTLMLFFIFITPALWWLNAIFGLLGSLFALYLWHCLQKALHPINIDKQKITFGKKSIPWHDIKNFKLRHYGGHKYSTSLSPNFFEVRLRSTNTKIIFDSDIKDFQKLLKLLMKEIEAHNINMDDSTAHNAAYVLKLK